jgi:hypothetical protein
MRLSIAGVALIVAFTLAGCFDGPRDLQDRKALPDRPDRKAKKAPSARSAPSVPLAQSAKPA